MADTDDQTTNQDTGSDDTGTDTDTDTSTDTSTDTGPPDHEAEAKKWKALSRQHEKRAKANADKAKKFDESEESDKTEVQKAADKAAKAEERATGAELKAARYEIADEKEVPRKLVKFITGSTKEEMEESADELLEAFKAEDEGDKPRGTGRPKERLKSGAAPDSGTDEADPGKIVANVPRY